MNLLMIISEINLNRWYLQKTSNKILSNQIQESFELSQKLRLRPKILLEALSIQGNLGFVVYQENDVFLLFLI